MAEQVVRLCDEVLPAAPMRQFVPSLPHVLRYRLAWDHRLLSAVLAIWARKIERWHALEAEATRPKPAAKRLTLCNGQSAKRPICEASDALQRQRSLLVSRAA